MSNSSMRRIHTVIAKAHGGNGLQANPTNMHLAPSTSHMVAALCLFDRSCAVRTVLDTPFSLVRPIVHASPEKSAQLKSPCRS